MSRHRRFRAILTASLVAVLGLVTPGLAQHGGGDRARPGVFSDRWRQAAPPRDRFGTARDRDRRCGQTGGGAVIGAIAGGLLGGGTPGYGDRGAAPIGGHGFDRDC